MSIFKLGNKEVPKEMAESQRGPNTNIANTGVLSALEGNKADTIANLPDNAQPKKFGTFEEFAAAIMDPNNPTYKMPTD